MTRAGSLRPWSAELEFVARLSRLAPTADDERRARTLASAALNWDRVVDVATHHGVTALVDAALRRLAPPFVPADVRAALRAARLSLLRNDLALHHAWLEVCEAFAAQDVRALTLKGFHVVHTVYGEVGLRPVGDLDFLVRADDVPAALQVFATCGYRPWDDFEAALRNVGLDRIVQSSTEMGLISTLGTVIDLHWAAGPTGARLDTDELIRDAQALHVDGREALVAPPDAALASHFLHGRKDAWRRLRWLVDAAEWLDRTTAADYAAMVRRLDALGRRSALDDALTLMESLWGRRPAVSNASGIRRGSGNARSVRYYQSVLEREYDWGHRFDRWRPVRMLRDRVGVASTLGAALVSAIRPNYFDWAFVALPRSLHFAYYLVRPVRILPQLVGRGTTRWRHGFATSGAFGRLFGRMARGLRGQRAVPRAVTPNPSLPRPPAGTPLTFVTAIYGSGPETLLGGRGRDISSYLPSLINIGNLGAPIVVYCPLLDVERVTEAIAPHFHAYKVVPFELARFEHFDTFTAWKQHYLPSLMINDRNEVLCFLKSYWLQRTAADNPFGHDQFFWIDAGLTHHGIFPERVGGVELRVTQPASHYFPANPRNVFTPRLGQTLAHAAPRGRLLFCALPTAPFPQRERYEAIAAETFDRAPGSVRITSHLVGGMFGGHREDIAAVHGLYAALLAAFIEGQAYALEEQVFSTLQAAHPERFALLRFDTWHFHAPDERTATLDAEANSFYKLFTKLQAHVAERAPMSMAPRKQIRVYRASDQGGYWFSEFVQRFIVDFLEPAYDVSYVGSAADDLKAREPLYRIGDRLCLMQAFVLGIEGVASGRMRLLAACDYPFDIFRHWNFDPQRVDRVLTAQYTPRRLAQDVSDYCRAPEATALRDAYERPWRPWIYGPWQWGLVEDVRTSPPPVVSRDLFFRGLFTRRRTVLTHLAEFTEPADRLDIAWWNGSAPERLPPREYLGELRRHAIALSLPGAGDLCNRDIECLALGVPMLRPVFSAELSVPLQAGIHYIGVPYEPAGSDGSGLPPDRPKDPRQLAHDLLATYRRVRDDAGLLADVARNGVEWYDRHIRYPASGQLTFDLLDLDSL